MNGTRGDFLYNINKYKYHIGGTRDKIRVKIYEGGVYNNILGVYISYALFKKPLYSKIK